MIKFFMDSGEHTPRGTHEVSIWGGNGGPKAYLSRVWAIVANISEIVGEKISEGEKRCKLG